MLASLELAEPDASCAAMVSLLLIPVARPPVGGLSFGPKPMFMATSNAFALFAELNFLAQVAIALPATRILAAERVGGEAIEAARRVKRRELRS